MANIDILQHQLDRFGVVTVMDATIYDYEKGAALLTLDTLKLSNINAEGQEKQIKGGKYADLLLTYNFGRSVSLEFQDALISPASMKQLWGAYANTGDVYAYGYETLTAASGDVTLTTLTDIPVGLSNLTTGLVYATTEWSNDAGVITITGTVADGNEIRVDYKRVNASATEIIINSAAFPKTVKLVGKTFVLNQNTGQQVDIEIEVPKLKLASNFTMTLDAEGDASVFDFSGMALIDGDDKELFKIRTLG